MAFTKINNLDAIFKFYEIQVIKNLAKKHSTEYLKAMIIKYDPKNGQQNVNLYRKRFPDEDYINYRTECKLFMTNLLWNAKINCIKKYLTTILTTNTKGYQ